MDKCSVREASRQLAAVPYFAQALAGAFNVTVKWDSKATTPGTDGEVIRMPRLRLPDDEGDVEEALRLAKLAVGYVVHEVGHVRHTNFLRAHERMARLPALARQLVNAIEDPRQENCLIAEFPGARLQLDDMLEAVTGPGRHYEPLKLGDEPVWVLTAYVLYTLRGELRGCPRFDALADESRPVAVEVFGERLVSRIEIQLRQDGPRMRNVDEAIDLAETICGLLKQEQEEQEQEQRNGKGGPSEATGESAGGQGQTGDQMDQSSGSGAQPDLGSGSAAGQADQQGQADQGKQAQDGQASQAGGGGCAGSDITGAIKSAMAADRGAGVQDLGDLLSEEIAQKNTMEGGLVHGGDIDLKQPVGRQYKAASPKVQFDPMPALQASNRLRRKLQNLIQALTLSREHESARGSLLNQRRIHRTSTGDRRLFVHFDETRKLDTAVFVLLDDSVSMRGTRIDLARQATYATACALHGIPGVQVAAGIFPGHKHCLGFGMNPRQAAPSFGVGADGSSTPLAQGVAWAGAQLVGRREARKVLLVLTDGQPDSRESAIAAMDAVIGLGVEVYGIGIELGDVKSFFDRAEVINELDGLQDAMFKVLQNSLRGQLAA